MDTNSEAAYFSILNIQSTLHCSFLEASIYYIQENDLDEEEFSKMMKNNALYLGELEACAKDNRLLNDRSKKQNRLL